MISHSVNDDGEGQARAYLLPMVVTPMPPDAKVAPLLQRCLQPADTRILHGQSLLRYVESPFGFWCDHNAPSEEREPLDGFHDMLFKRGNEHEAQVVEAEWPDAESVGYTTDEEGFEAALALMFAGATGLAGMPLTHAPSGMGGRVDMLIRVDEASSVFGPFQYQVVEIKSAKNLTKGHLMQAAFYTRLLGEIQDHTPNEFHLVNGDGDVTSYPFADHKSELDEIIEEARAVREESRPRPCYGSTPWPWSEYGDRLAVATRDVSLLASVGPSLQRTLVESGYETVDQVAAAAEEELIRVRGVGASTANRLITKAQAIVGGRPIRRDGPLTIPEAEIEGFLDLEGTDPRAEAEGLSVTNYLIGILTRIDGEVEYIPFFAESPEDEGRNLRAFLQWLSENPGMTLYHWHHYEQTHLLKMMEHYGALGADREILAGSLVDLHPIATKAFAFPCYGDGLKPIARSIGFEWRQEDVNALESVVLYHRYVTTGDAAFRQRILDYNEDDCRATMGVKDWLIQRQHD